MTSVCHDVYMCFRDRYQKKHQGFGPVALYLGLPLLTLVIPVIALVTGARRRRLNEEGMSISEFGWGNMLWVWLILLAFIYLVYIPFLAPVMERRRQRKPNRHIGADPKDS
ncbi:MAG: hypothetical protein HLX51_04510 [Micrococcaceae bacterium]|nr:hypothetical protein [Micrococcaceae bacterium]